MKIWTVTEAARNFSDLVGGVYYGGEEIVLTKGGKPVVKVVSARPAKTGKELAAIWPSLEKMSASEAESFAKDIDKGRAKILPPVSKWD